MELHVNVLIPAACSYTLLFPLIVNGCLCPLVICILGLALYPDHVGGEKHLSSPTRSGYEANLLHFDAKVTEKERV